MTHTFLPPTVIYMRSAHPAARTTDFSSLQCFWYGAAPMSAARLEEAIGGVRSGDGAAVRPVRGADDDLDDVAGRPPATPTARWRVERLASAGRPSPLVTVAIMDEDGDLLHAG